MFRVLQIPAFRVPGLQIPAFRAPGFTDSGFSCSGFYRFRLFVFRVLQIPAFRVPGFTDSGFSCSGFYRFRLFMFRVLQIPAFHVPVFSFLVSFLVPFPDSPFLVLQIATRFLSILLSLKTIGKGVKFQDITPIRATFYKHNC